ncbi:MAG: phosphate signaling complex protein PhoU [Bacteroidota bacterium]|nr:phosphate signaling complex protein PhoU [Bacteroidota bacterium]MDP4229104.1 phosphate signaling complex protein PhoU [Bacteroidota bacterium]MDP4235023.1 phosphate signaling complex protein PhoU [Bacteroidota bacterium]
MATLSTTPRIHRHFEDELEKLRALLIRMGSLVDEQVELATRAVLQTDMEAARFVLKREARVNEYDLMVDGLCQRILALTQPVAIDLRMLIAAMRIDSEFERIGDIAVNLAERVEPLAGYTEILERVGIKNMIAEATKMFRDAFDAFINNDAELARSLFDRDDTVDEIARQAFEKLIAEMKSDPGHIEPAAHAMVVIRHVERLADHATNIAEDVVFIVEAKMMKHHLPEDISLKDED